MRRYVLLLLIAPVLVAADDIPPLAPGMQAMLDAAIASGNESEIAVIAKYLSAASPDHAAAINARVDTWRGEREAARMAKLRDGDIFENWRGRAELGGYISTGNTDTIGVTGALDLTRESVSWRHKVRLQADYQRNSGVTSRERYLAAYEPNYKFDDRGYVYGASQYESDRFLGYINRTSLSLGAGYKVLQGKGLRLELELGPAWRRTDFTDGNMESSAAARGSLDFGWELLPSVKLTQQASVYAERFNSTYNGTTALTARLIGPLSARLSYNLQFESQPPTGRETTDSISRASLVYEF